MNGDVIIYREAREWFIRQEQRLLALRFTQLKPEAKQVFFQETGNNYRRYNPKSIKQQKVRKKYFFAFL